MKIGAEVWKVSDKNSTDVNDWTGFYVWKSEAILEGKAKYNNANFYIVKGVVHDEEGTVWTLSEQPEYIPTEYEFVPNVIQYKLY
jgi:hypothetical protein